ncbi:MAG: N-acetyltransferase [Pseudomonadota bacterium]
MVEFLEAKEGDYQAICDLVSSPDELYWVHPRGHYPWTPEQIRRLASERKELTVAVREGEILAFANLYDLQPKSHAFIGNLIVGSGYRKQGIGREMLRHMLALAVEKYRLAEARISVFSHNVQALLLYADLGFTPYGIEERRDLHGERVALVHLAKNLDTELTSLCR